jgi:hypothetical protein
MQVWTRRHFPEDFLGRCYGERGLNEKARFKEDLKRNGPFQSIWRYRWWIVQQIAWIMLTRSLSLRYTTIYSNSPKYAKSMHSSSSLPFYLSLNSCENIFCQTSIHFCCWAVRGFPGFLKDRVKISRNLDRNILTTSIVFQSDTANRALLPSRMKTPAYIYQTLTQILWTKGIATHIAANISAE